MSALECSEVTHPRDPPWPLVVAIHLFFSLNTLQLSNYSFKLPHFEFFEHYYGVLTLAWTPLPRTNSASFSRGDWIRVGLCYPRGTTFSILSDVHNRLLKQTSKTGTFVRTLQMDKVEQSYPGRSHYYWDEDSG